MADDPSVYGSAMNFFLPPQARVGSSVASTPGLFDMLGGMGMGGWPGASSSTSSSSSDTPEQQQQKKRQQQQMAMAQAGMKMMAPQQLPTQQMPQMIPNTVAPQQQQPQQGASYSPPPDVAQRNVQRAPMMPRSPFGNY